MWNEQDRQILAVEVGKRVHKLDPLPVLRRYRAGVSKMGTENFQRGLEQLIKGEETPQLAALQIPILYEVMNWPRYEDDPANGYTEGELLSGFTQFLEWLVDSKKKDETSPPSAGSAGGSGETPVTPNTSPSSSAGDWCNPDGLGSTPPAPV